MHTYTAISYIYFPFSPDTLIICSSDSFLHPISINLSSMFNVSEVKVTSAMWQRQRGTVALKAHTAFRCLIQSNKWAFALAVSQKDKCLHMGTYTQTHTQSSNPPPHQGCDGCCYSEKSPTRCCYPRS